MERRVTPPRRVTSPTWGPPPPCKQALIIGGFQCHAIQSVDQNKNQNCSID